MVLPLSTVPRRVETRRALRAGPWGNLINTITYRFDRLATTNQKPPYNIDTDLDVMVSTSDKGAANATAFYVDPVSNPAYQEAVNKARAKFIGKLGDSSSFGATLTTELKSSWATVSGGITNSLLAANAVRRGRLGEAAKYLGFYPPEVKRRVPVRRRKYRNGTRIKRKITLTRWRMPDGREVTKSLGNKWLWYSYGVKPLLQDIHNGMEVLCREPPSTKVEVGASARVAQHISDYYDYDRVYKASVRVSAHVRVKNPNLWLANQLGLINPVQMFLEGVKLSFVVDWFSNLSQIVSQMTDLQGLEITRPITTSKSNFHQIQKWPGSDYLEEGSALYIQRRSVIPQAKLRFAYERFEWQRALNAISLLTGYLGK